MITYWLYIYCYIMKFMIYFQCNKGRIQEIMWLKLIRKLKWLTVVFSVTTSSFKVKKAAIFRLCSIFYNLYLYNCISITGRLFLSLHHFCILNQTAFRFARTTFSTSDSRLEFLLKLFSFFFLPPFLLPLEFPPSE